MNNDQFRKLMLASSAKSSGSKNGGSTNSPSAASGSSSLGSRQRPSVSMTPSVTTQDSRSHGRHEGLTFFQRRSVGGAQVDFARQVAERNRALNPQKKFKSATPRGVKLGEGYVDRARRQEEDATDEREERLKALEKSLKDEEIDQETYDKLRSHIAGGDLESTHLVKGLDFKLLERIRKGEDVYRNGETTENIETAIEDDVDDEFDQLEEREVQAIEKEKAREKKKGQLSTVALAPGTKRTRDQILADLKASRMAALAQQESALGDRFRKIGDKKMPGRRIERDHKGREVLIIVDEDGHEKRKVRKVQPGGDDRSGLLMPDKDAKPLGMEVPEEYRKKQEPEEEDGDVDIFDDVGDDYDPLAGMDGSDSEGSEDESNEKQRTKGEERGKDVGESTQSTKDESLPPPSKPTAPRNYFQDSKTGLISEQASQGPSMSDPAMLAAIRKAASLKQLKTDEEEDMSDSERKAKALAEERRKKLLSMHDRDDDDIDMGFGTSRFEDEEDFAEGSKVKLSKWRGGITNENGDGDGDSDEQGGRGGSKRKRGPKKRKGDGNNAADVMRVIEQRKRD